MWDVGDAYFSYMFLSGYGADLFGPNGDDKATLGFDTQNGVDALTFYQSLRSIYDVNAEDASGDARTAAFKSGNAAYVIDGPWAIQDYTNEGVSFGIIPIPVFPNGKSPRTFSGIKGNYINAFSKHPEESKLFAAFLSSKEMLEKRYEMTSQIPPHSEIVIDNEHSNGILKQAVYAVPMPSIPAMGSYWGPMATTFANIWNGSDVKSQIDAAATAMRETIQ